MTDNFFEHKFNDYASLETSLHAWQTTNFVQLVKRNCPKVKLNADKSNSRELSNRVYESLYYQCIHYGEPRANCHTVDNSRPNQSLNAVGCKCFFHYKWSDGKFYLFNYNKNHLNHPETKAHWETHPNQRKVKDADRIAAGFFGFFQKTPNFFAAK